MRRIDGIWWPDDDVECHRVVPKQVGDLEKVLPYVRKFDTVVQAGGNVGIWPGYLSSTFHKVITFEPDKENFECLMANIGLIENIRYFNAALGDKPGKCGMDRTPKNAGAHQIDGDGDIEIVTLDGMDLDSCDLIVLDVEGYEPQALMGADRIIEKFAPVIVVEDKGLTERYGVPEGWSEGFPGYRVAKKVHRDVILVPE